MIKESFNNIDGHLLAILQLSHAAQLTRALGGVQSNYLEALESSTRQGKLDMFLTNSSVWTKVVKLLSKHQIRYWKGVFSSSDLLQRKKWIFTLLTSISDQDFQTSVGVLLTNLGLDWEKFKGIYVGR